MKSILIIIAVLVCAVYAVPYAAFGDETAMRAAIDNIEATNDTTTAAPTTPANLTTVTHSTNVTTEAPTNVTTEAPTNVTTEAPTNVTTQAPTNVTTEAPTNVTTEAPTNVTTIAPTGNTTETTSSVTPTITTTHASTTQKPSSGSKFDVGSFFGGVGAMVGVIIIAAIAYQCYKKRSTGGYKSM